MADNKIIYHGGKEDVISNISVNDKIIKNLNDVYGSWISESISNFNSDFLYQPHD